MKLSNLFILSSLLILAGCSTPPAIQTETLPEFDAANYSTFAILEPPENPLSPASPALIRTAKMVMGSALKGKGLTETDAESADLVFQAAGGSIPTANATQYGFFYAGDGWMYYPVSYHRTNFNSQSSGLIAVNAFDNKSKQLVWQAVSHSTTHSSSMSSKAAFDSLKLIMARYPDKQ